MTNRNWDTWEDCEISDLVGKTLTSCVVNNDCDEITFTTDSGQSYIMCHNQDCCENVRIDDIAGDLADLVGSPILQAEAAEGETPPERDLSESYTWTFYKLGTNRGRVTLRWLGESNGYYSESVDFYRIGGAS